MGLLDNLWDDTIAGPRPDSGLGKLRKYNSLPTNNGIVPLSVSVPEVVDVPISRSITIVKPNSNFRNFSADSGSVPSSPASSNTPSSPFSPRTPRSDMKRLSRRKTISEAFERAEPRSPTVYDWVVISALDR
ncbi:Dormancy/auxin associated family protein [Thalictrum thalictroides]|uniref:Dormancy/auxin associated family protein n=1 Tax=Thalictrum thalictroides TaxID=46969 RepID=A0A7J6X917_THATH|nr:Dormancy/auxin associated family protein [Thalictrum thalictroides]